METFTIESSEGTLTCDIATGKVVKYDDQIVGSYLNDIDVFNIPEWKAYQASVKGSWDITDGLDVLEIGFTTKNGEYVEPSLSHRKYLYEQGI